MAIKTVTNVGSPTLDTTTKQFGAASMGVIATTGVKVTDDADFDLSTGDFTMEAFIYPTSNSTNGTIGKADYSSGNTYVNYGFATYGGASPGMYVWLINSGLGVIYQNIVGSISINNWHHLALVRSGDNFYAYIDGTRTTLSTGGGTLNNSVGKNFFIGAQYDGTSGIIGNIDELRVSKGIARYTDASVSVPSAEFTTDAYTVLLMHFNASPFIDESVASSSTTHSLSLLDCGT